MFKHFKVQLEAGFPEALNVQMRMLPGAGELVGQAMLGVKHSYLAYPCSSGEHWHHVDQSDVLMSA